MILLNPGPVVVSERVRRALSKPDICHREPEFADLQDEIRARLLEVYGLSPREWAAVLLSGSGTAAMEAMLTSLVPSDRSLLVIENGVYGERLTRIAKAHAIAVRQLHFEWRSKIDLGALDHALAVAPEIDQIAVVQHETTTGRLNDLEAVGALCRSHGATMLVDGVSSYGAEPLDFEGWNLEACAATANKCLHGVPGVCFVVVRRRALALGTEARRSVYLDLGNYCDHQDRRTTPFTPAVPGFHGLAEALRELEETGGRQARHARYRDLAERVRIGLAEMGVEPLLAPADSSVVLRSYRLPVGLSYEELHDRLKARGFVIYAGQGRLQDRMFRVSTMGEIGDDDIDRLLRAFREVIGSPGGP